MFRTEDLLDEKRAVCKLLVAAVRINGSRRGVTVVEFIAFGINHRVRAHHLEDIAVVRGLADIPFLSTSLNPSNAALLCASIRG